MVLFMQATNCVRAKNSIFKRIFMFQTCAPFFRSFTKAQLPIVLGKFCLKSFLAILWAWIPLCCVTRK